MRHFRRRPLLAIAAALSLTACSHDLPKGGDGSDNGSGKTDSLFPDGSDLLGRITVVPLALPNVAPVVNYSITHDTTRRQLYVSTAPPNNARVNEGKNWVTINSSYLGIDVAPIEVAAKETVTIALGGLHVDGYQQYPVTIGIAPRWTGSRADVLRDPNGAIISDSWATLPGRYVQVLPLPFSYWLWGDQAILERPVDVVAGGLTEVDLAIPDPRVRFDVSSPVRQLPDAEPAPNHQVFLGTNPSLTLPTFAAFSGAIPCETPSNQGNYSYSGCLSAFVQHGKYAKTATAIGSNFTKQQYYFVINGVYVELQGEAGQTVEAPVRRLDVHDVAVEIEDGSTQSIKGTWSLAWYWPKANQYVELSWFKDRPTGTGVDLVPGKYRATVAYERSQQPSPDVRIYELELK